MFLIGFICGVLVLTVLLLLLCDSDEDGAYDEEEQFAEQLSNMQTTQSWQQTRNFLYYDGTEMPLKKEEHYE